MQRALLAALAASSVAELASSQGVCPPQGLGVAAYGGRLGDAWHVDIGGTPSVLAVIGIDVAPGPVPTPFGTICLGLTPNLQIAAVVVNAVGFASIGGVMPANPAIAGITIHATAISFDPSLPGGIGIGNDASFRLRQPRFWFVSPGSSTPFGTTPGAIAATNGISDDVAFAQALTTSVRDAATVPGLAWLTLLLGNGSLVAYDGISTTPVMSTTLTGAAAQAGKLLAMSESGVLLLAFGTPPGPFGGGTPGSVHFVDLPTGTLAWSVPLPAGNPDAMIRVPGTDLVVLRTATGLVPFLVTGTGFIFPEVPLPSGFGPVVDWQLAGGLLYCLHGGQAAGSFGGGLPAAISVFDLATWSVQSTNALAMTAPVQMLRAGPGSAGPAVYVYGASGVLEELAQGSLQSVASIPVGTGIVAMELSSLGTQWLLLCNANACGGPSLHALLAGTTFVLPLAALSAPQSALAVSPTAAYGKAAVVLGTNVAAPFRTDPFTSVASTVLPSGASTWWIRVD